MTSFISRDNSMFDEVDIELANQGRWKDIAERVKLRRETRFAGKMCIELALKDVLKRLVEIESEGLANTEDAQAATKAAMVVLKDEFGFDGFEYKREDLDEYIKRKRMEEERKTKKEKDEKK